MALEKPRINRLTALITLLQSKVIITATEIAERFNVSIRTVYRDIKTLNDSGIPVITIDGRGYSLQEDFKMKPVMLSEKEALALITAEQIINKNKDVSLSKTYQQVVTKVKAGLQKKALKKAEMLEDRIQVRSNRHTPSSHILLDIQSCIIDCKVIMITYKDENHQLSSREIEPFALYTTQGNWILIAFCRLRSDFRAFRLDRIIHCQVTASFFSSHELTLQEYFKQCVVNQKYTPDTPLTSPLSTFDQNLKIMNVEKVTLSSFKVIGIMVRTSNIDNQAAQDIPELWQRYMEESIHSIIPNKLGDKVMAIYTDYEGDHMAPYSTIIGCRVSSLDEIPEGMVGKDLPGGAFAKSQVTGNLKEGIIIKEWMRIWNSDLQRRYAVDFEEYTMEEPGMGHAHVDFYVSIHEV